MMNFKKIYYFALFIWTVCFFYIGCIHAQEKFPTDNKAADETVKLYRALFADTGQIRLGHQDDLAYGHGWYGEEGRSDVKSVTGNYPGVIGWEVGDIELGRAVNLDSVYFEDMRRYIQETHKRGGLTTISWHANNIVTGGNAWDCQQDTVVRSVLPGGKHHEAYLNWLDCVADFFLSLQNNDGHFIPIIFRPYHEHTGTWFWWGAEQCSPDEYKALWRMTVKYMREEKNIHHILYCYSPSETIDKAHYLERYPGDDLVDMLAFDCYVPGVGTPDDLAQYSGAMKHNINIVTSLARKTGKIATIGETGLEGVNYPHYFTKIVYPLIRDKALAWILFWRNAYEQDKPSHFYVPFKGHPAEDDFKKFVKMEGILMSPEMK